jgi:flavin reductase (DIM6/NTAB) family NADH-FMN oxidoreductase RutF
MARSATDYISYGLYVVTAEEYKDNGCITNTACQVTTTPNRITLAVNKTNLTHDMIAHTGKFNVSMLSEEAPFAYFTRFGFQSGRSADKFDGFGEVARSENGLYYITKGTNAFVSAQVCRSIDLGTHTLFIADVTESAVLSDVPSMTYAYYHANVKPKAARPKKTVWRCRICGYEYEGEELPADFVCPICKHGAADFEKIEG